MVWEQFLNRNIKIIQKDGFRKFGILREEKDGFLRLEFYDGSGTVLINLDSISWVGEDSK